MEKARRKKPQALKSDGFSGASVSAILDSATDLLVVLVDEDGRIVHFNHVCEELMGYSVEEVRSRYVWDLFVLAEEAGEAPREFRRHVRQGLARQRERTCRAKDGRILTISWTVTYVKNGGATYLIGAGIDVTKRCAAEQQAEHSEATIRALLEAAPQAIVACERNGRIVLANAMAEKMFGYSRKVLREKTIETLMPEEFRARHLSQREEWFTKPGGRHTPFEIELQGLRKDGSEFPIEVRLGFSGRHDGILGVAFISDISGRKKNERALSEYRQRLQQLAGALLTARETANREVARELHDVFSQELAITAMEIANANELLRGNDAVVKMLSGVGARIAQLSANLHRTARNLHPSIVEELGLEPALRQECESFRETAGIKTKFRASKMPPSIPNEKALCLYRVAQESLRNVQKHSCSRMVEISVQGSPQDITLKIRDAGDGFDLDKAMKKGGLGLISMEERVRLVNGKLSVQSQPGIGTIVTAQVPL